jgi:beta-phosphoglucomutase-like phosphatase (HAD superfamily)
MKRVGITPPPVTITADDKRLKAGKPAPDPFLLAAECLGYDAARCVVFEDSPSGIRAGVASGATVIAVCTSHERPQIENCGAHYIVENLKRVSCEVEGDRLKFTILSVDK